MKSMRLFRVLSSSAAINDERSCASARIIRGQAENERLRRELQEAQATIRRLQPSHASSRDMFSVDDSTVVSNASTVKAGTSPKRNHRSPAAPWNAPILKAPTLPTTSSVASEPPAKGKRLFFNFRKTRNETVLSEAALKVAQQDHEVATRKERRQRQQLSVPMKRYLCNFDSPRSDTTSATCDILAEF